ncbi:MAG: carboxymuconolactone decarboxylase family protein [Anaerolineales bacterium]|nr:carboxymuconolactone decarboxylase family protein [Anaerolineales bacterium]
MKKKFNKRLYPNLKELISDLGFVFRRRDKMKALMRGEVIDAQFRERLMMAVTEVNGCRYCAYYHAQQALAAGIGSEELEEISKFSFESSPEGQRPALLYAQHWAETGGHPDPDAWGCMQDSYSLEELELIELCLHTIQIGNLTGNLADYLLFRLSFGRADIESMPKMGKIQ